MAQWYQLKMSLYLTEDQADVLGREWNGVFMRTMKGIFPSPTPTFYMADESMKPEVENADD